MTDAIRQYIDTHIPENHRQGDGCWDAAQKELGEPMTADLTAEPMDPIIAEYEAAAEQFRNARGKTERDAARRRWDAAKAAMDGKIIAADTAHEPFVCCSDHYPPARPSDDLTGLDVDRLARATFLYRTATNIPLPDDFWERQSPALQQPFRDEATAILAALAAEGSGE